MSRLPPLADANDIEIVRRLCSEGRAILNRKDNRQTERLLLQVWKVPLARLQAAVAEHIEQKRKIFLKFDEAGRCLVGKMHANVTLAEELDVYVEMDLRNDTIVILAAHSHYTLPLPQ